MTEHHQKQRRRLLAGALLSSLLPTARAAGTPQRVLVFDLGLLDTLDALGVDVVGVPAWKMPAALARYEGAAYAKVGTLFEPDWAAVAAAAPDLILIGSRMRAHQARLAALATTVDLSGTPADFYAGFYTGVERNARTLGRIFAKEAEVEARLARLQASIAGLKQQAAGAGTGLILVIINGTICAYGPGSRFGLLHDVFGLRAADPALTPASHLQPVSHDYILKINPDWLFVIDRDAAVGAADAKPAAQLLDHPLVAATRAWQQGRLVYLDPVRQYLSSAGLRVEQQNIDSLSLAFSGRPAGSPPPGPG